jgi:hypothetical protein
VLILSAVLGKAAAAAQARAILVATVEAAILAALANGPAKMTALCAAAQLGRKRLYRILDPMHHAGAVRRLGVKGWSVWCLPSYTGPRPVVRHPPHIPRSRPVITSPERTSWWLNVPTRAAFEQALERCRVARGWGR